MPQKTLKNVESPSIVNLNEVSALSLPHEAIENLYSTDEILYVCERRSRQWLGEHIVALKALSVNKEDAVSPGNSDELIRMHIPRYGQVALPIKMPSAKADPSQSIRELVEFIELVTGLRPWRATSSIAEEITQDSAKLKEAQVKYSVLQKKYNQLITVHDEVELAYHSGDGLGDEAQSSVALDKSTEERSDLFDNAQSKGGRAAERLAVSRGDIQSVRVALHKQSLEVTKLSATIGYLERYVQQLEADNQNNPTPIRATLRLDNRLKTLDSLRYLSEMGYKIKNS